MTPEDKAEYFRHYQLEKEQGEAFFPFSVVKDGAVALLVFLALIALVYAFGAPLESRADPTNASYIPRPEWYFLFLFELLKYFPGDLEFVGVVGVPTIGIVLLLALPLLDRSPWRHPVHRPLPIVVTAVALVGVLFLTVRAVQATPSGSAASPGASTPAGEAGRQLYQAQNCAGCHSLTKGGGTAGPSLAGLADRRTLAETAAYIANPRSANPNSIMPSYGGTLSAKEVDEIAEYLFQASP